VELVIDPEPGVRVDRVGARAEGTETRGSVLVDIRRGLSATFHWPECANRVLSAAAPTLNSPRRRCPATPLFACALSSSGLGNHPAIVASHSTDIHLGIASAKPEDVPLGSAPLVIRRNKVSRPACAGWLCKHVLCALDPALIVRRCAVV
jgi:hypothetical protein